ncbi:ATP-grasp domain-containing protein [Facilibium subflavum]|uniref:ATP-grasp domain-containing protein n=1 Tax=Facilibium subflavum TaxID=2219058 RepID=UPI000E649A14|nr:ATP-grasp domain-containing protein [Facilibium subflavum]
MQNILVLLDAVPGTNLCIKNDVVRYFGQKPLFSTASVQKSVFYETEIVSLGHFDDQVYRISEVIESVQNTMGSAICVVSGSEASVYTGAHLRTKYGIPGLQEKQAVFFRNKYKMYEHAKKCRGLKPIETYQLSEAAILSNNNEMMVIKPKEMSGSIGVLIGKFADISKHVNLISPLENKHDYIIQPKIEGEIWHIDGIWAQGSSYFVASQYVSTPTKWRMRESCYASLSLELSVFQHDLIETFLKDYFSKLNIDFTPFHLEVINSSEGLNFLEIAARPGGGPISDALEARVNASKS